MNRLKSIIRSVTGSVRNDEQNDEKAQTESEAEAMEVEASESETFDDTVNENNVNGAVHTDENKIASSENESEIGGNANSGPKLAHAAQLEEAESQNHAQTKEVQAETLGNNVEKENLPKGSMGRERIVVCTKRKAEDVAGNKQKKLQPLIEINIAETTPGNEVIEVKEETVSVTEEEEIRIMDTSEQNGSQDSSPKCSQDTERDMIRKKALRRDLKLWMKTYENINKGNLCSAINGLADLRSRHRPCEDWEKEALSLRDVQEKMKHAVKYVKNITDAKQKREVAAALRHVLTVPGKIQVPFPSLIEIDERLQQVEDGSRCPSFRVAYVEQLPGYLKSCLYQMEMTDFNLKQLQGELESTMKSWSKRKSHCYEYQTSVGVFHLFGLDSVDFSFRSRLSKEDFISLSEMIEVHLANVGNTSQKQAYLLNLALCNIENRHAAVMYMIKHMPKGMCKELKKAVKRSSGDNNTVDTKKLRQEIQKMLPEAVLKHNLTALTQAFKYQLKFANRSQTFAEGEMNDHKSGQLDTSVAQLLKIMNMMQYHPQKLTYEDVVKLGSDVYDDVNKKPTSLSELSWYFMKHIIGWDSDTREKCHIALSQDGDSSDSDDSDDDMDDGHIK